MASLQVCRGFASYTGSVNAKEEEQLTRQEGESQGSDHIEEHSIAQQHSHPQPDPPIPCLHPKGRQNCIADLDVGVVLVHCLPVGCGELIERQRAHGVGYRGDPIGPNPPAPDVGCIPSASTSALQI